MAGLGFPGNSAGKECAKSTCSAGDPGSIPRLGRSPGGGHDSPLQYSCLKDPQGQRSPVGCGPRGHEESDSTERLSTAQPHCTGHFVFLTLGIHISAHFTGENTEAGAVT